MGIKKNIVYSTILTVSGYLFPILTFPYVTRVLGVKNFGICNFYDGVISYFILFSMLGIVNLGIREIAKCKADKEKIRKTFQSLFILNILSTFVAIVILIICGLFIEKLSEHPQLIYIGVAKVLANCLLIEWLYKGLEDFRYITIRSLIIRTCYVISVFIFVKDPEDYILYFALTTSMFVINALVNLYKAKVYFIKWGKLISVRYYLRPFFVLGIYQLLTSMYTTFNIVYLGFICSDVQVGYYSAATKLYTIIISFYTSFTGVMLPRMSALWAEQRIEEFKAYISKSIKLLYSISFPAIVISIVFAPFIITLIAGNQFEGAIQPLRIVMPLMLIIGLEQIIVYQILFPANKDKAILINSIIGAIVGISLNILLVHKYEAVGSAMAWLVSELAVLVSAYYFINKSIKIKLETSILIVLSIISLSIIALLECTEFGKFQNWETFIPVSFVIMAIFLFIDIYIVKTIDISSIIRRFSIGKNKFK